MKKSKINDKGDKKQSITYCFIRNLLKRKSKNHSIPEYQVHEKINT